jgi:hypothetical protein
VLQSPWRHHCGESILFNFDLLPLICNSDTTAKGDTVESQGVHLGNVDNLLTFFQAIATTALLSKILELVHVLWVVGNLRRFEKQAMLQIINHPMHMCGIQVIYYSYAPNHLPMTRHARLVKMDNSSPWNFQTLTWLRAQFVPIQFVPIQFVPVDNYITMLHGKCGKVFSLTPNQFCES